MSHQETSSEPSASPADRGERARTSRPARIAHALRVRPRIAFGMLAGGLLILTAVGVAWHRLATRESTDDAFVEAHVAVVSSRIAGTVTAVRVEENQAVDEGEVVVEIDPRDLQLAVRHAEANLAAAEAARAVAAARVPVATVLSSSNRSSARAQVERSKAAAAAAGDAVEAAAAHLEAARARALQARQDLERLGRLVDKDEVSREEYEHAQAASTAADAAVAAATREVEVARSRHSQSEAEVAQAEAGAEQAAAGPQQVAASRAELEAAQARVAQSKAALELARAQLADADIRAPRAGVVGRRNVETGQTVAPGQALMAIVPDEVWVTANFKETQLAKMRPGQRAIVHVDAYGTDLEGHVESLGAATGSSFSLLPASNASGNFIKVVQRIPVRIVLDAPLEAARPLRPGMSVVPTVIVR